jgi:hypothetical protein
LIDVFPAAAEFGCCGCVDFFVEDTSAVIFDAIFDGCNGENEGEGKDGNGACCSSEYGEYCKKRVVRR